jgi:hypothetical protein
MYESKSLIRIANWTATSVLSRPFVHAMLIARSKFTKTIVHWNWESDT